MTLYERYIGSEILDLIRILENAQDYTTECIDVILEILKDRNINIEEIMDDILLVNRAIVKKKLDISMNIYLYLAMFFCQMYSKELNLNT